MTYTNPAQHVLTMFKPSCPIFKIKCHEMLYGRSVFDCYRRFETNTGNTVKYLSDTSSLYFGAFNDSLTDFS